MGRSRSKKRVPGPNQAELRQALFFAKFSGIPRCFQLFGHIYTVIFVEGLQGDRACVGRVDNHTNVIELDPNQSVSCVEQTFWHEVMHVILFCLDVKQNERLVEQIAQCLYQILVTMSREQLS